MKIRHATKEDAPFLATTILMAGRAHVQKGIWEVILGSSEQECVSFLKNLAVTQIPHLFHYSFYLIAEKDGVGPIGSLGGYDPKEFGYNALMQAIPEVTMKLQLPEQAFNNSQERSSKMLACIPKEIEGAWVIDSVATLPSHRSSGVAEKLLTEILEKGKNQGHSKAQVSMYIGNEPALKLYRKLGFEIVEENRDHYFEENIGSPGMMSLARDL